MQAVHIGSLGTALAAWREVQSHYIQRTPHLADEGFRKWRLPLSPERRPVNREERPPPRRAYATLLLAPHPAVQYHRRCCLSLLPSPLSAPLLFALSPAPARRRRAQPTPRMALSARTPHAPHRPPPQTPRAPLKQAWRCQTEIRPPGT